MDQVAVELDLVQVLAQQKTITLVLNQAALVVAAVVKAKIHLAVTAPAAKTFSLPRSILLKSKLFFTSVSTMENAIQVQQARVLLNFQNATMPKTC